MQIFNYTAKDQSGTSIKGKVEARDLQHAANVLREKQLVIIKLTAVLEDHAFSLSSLLGNRISSQDLVAFTQQLATMINSGLPLSDGLTLLQTQSKQSFAKIIGEMARDIQGGSSFTDALIARKGVFSKVYIASIKAGEASDKLDEVLTSLAENEENKREFASKTKGAMIYPIIVIIVMVIVVFLMMVLVIPQLTAIFVDFNVELPFATKALIAISNFFKNLWWVFVAGVAGGVYLLRNWYKTKIGRQRIDELLLKLPIYGKLRIQIMLADITRTLALLVSSGISILGALEIVTDSANNVVFEKALKSTADGVEKGLPLATMLAREQVFPILMSQMVSVGEETGQLAPILQKVARYYERESEHAIKNLTTAIEPLIMVLLGVGVLFLVFAIMMPIYSLTSSF